MFPRIVKELEAVVPDLKSKTAEAEAAAIRKQREWADQQERWKREQDRRNADKALAQSREQLSEVIRKWSAAMSIESFFARRRSVLPASRPTGARPCPLGLIWRGP